MTQSQRKEAFRMESEKSGNPVELFTKIRSVKMT